MVRKTIKTMASRLHSRVHSAAGCRQYGVYAEPGRALELLGDTVGVARSPLSTSTVGAMAQKRGIVCMLVAACLSLSPSPLHVVAQPRDSKTDRVNFYDAKCSACNTVAMELEFALKAEQKKHNGGVDFGVDLRSRTDSKGDRLGHDTARRHRRHRRHRQHHRRRPERRRRRCQRQRHRREPLLNRCYSPCRRHRRCRGQLDSRVGKVVNYAISELRSIELLEGLCMNMDDYKLSKTKQGVPTYIKVNNHGGSFTVDGTMTLGGDQSSVDSVKLHSYCDLLLELYEEDFEAAVRSTNPELILALAKKVCVESEQVLHPRWLSDLLPPFSTFSNLYQPPPPPSTSSHNSRHTFLPPLPLNLLSQLTPHIHPFPLRYAVRRHWRTSTKGGSQACSQVTRRRGRPKRCARISFVFHTQPTYQPPLPHSPSHSFPHTHARAHARAQKSKEGKVGKKKKKGKGKKKEAPKPWEVQPKASAHSAVPGN